MHPTGSQLIVMDSVDKGGPQPRILFARKPLAEAGDELLGAEAI